MQDKAFLTRMRFKPVPSTARLDVLSEELLVAHAGGETAEHIPDPHPANAGLSAAFRWLQGDDSPVVHEASLDASRSECTPVHSVDEGLRGCRLARTSMRSVSATAIGDSGQPIQLLARIPERSPNLDRMQLPVRD